MTRADHYPPTDAHGWPLVDGQAAADFYRVDPAMWRLLASRHGIRAVCIRHRRAYYTGEDAKTLARIAIARGVSRLATCDDLVYSSRHGRLCP